MADCIQPSIARGDMDIVVLGHKYEENFHEHYIWKLGLSNTRIVLYRRERENDLARTWSGPCGVRAEERILLPNKGRDASGFYHYALTAHEQPPKAVAFLHGHFASAWHTSCKAIVSRLVRYYRGIATPPTWNVESMVTLTHSESHGLMNPFKWFGAARRRLSNDETVKTKCANLTNAFKRVSDFNSCCGSFIMPGANLRLQSKDTLQALLNYTLTEPNDQQSGRHCYEFVVYEMFHTQANRTQLERWYKEAHGQHNVKRLVHLCMSARRF